MSKVAAGTGRKGHKKYLEV